MKSPNYNSRPEGVDISLIVVHGTGGTDQGDLSWLRNPASKVSYHYLILRDGTVYSEVPEEKRAWHAGASSWNDVPNCNDYSIGIGLSNLGPGVEEMYTEEQYRALNQLIWDIHARRGRLEVVGHSDVSPGRKHDPWHYFNWNRIITLPDPILYRPKISVVWI